MDTLRNLVSLDSMTSENAAESSWEAAMPVGADMAGRKVGRVRETAGRPWQLESHRAFAPTAQLYPALAQR